MSSLMSLCVCSPHHWQEVRDALQDEKQRHMEKSHHLGARLQVNWTSVSMQPTVLPSRWLPRLHEYMSPWQQIVLCLFWGTVDTMVVENCVYYVLWLKCQLFSLIEISQFCCEMFVNRRQLVVFAFLYHCTCAHPMQ